MVKAAIKQPMPQLFKMPAMTRRVVITGLGPVSAVGLGIEPTWEAAVAGRSGIGPITAFDASGFDCRIAGEVRDLSVKDFVPKNYRKATKVMARDIELAVVAADFAARDAALVTRGTNPDEAPSYAPHRVGAHIGAGLIAGELNELTTALAEARAEDGSFDIHRWGESGMEHLTPLWLLKYLPNMLACHVTIIHDCQGPSNTITCAEASAGLSIGESLRVIQRGAADACFCGGAESKLNPMAFLRQLMTGRYNTTSNDDGSRAVRPFCQNAAGSIVGEGGGIVVLEALETFRQRYAAASGDVKPRAYAEIAGFGASQTVNREARNLRPDPEGRGIAVAIRAALREANVAPGDIDLIIAFGLGLRETDAAEAEALKRVFGETLSGVPVVSTKALVGNCGAGAGGLDVCLAARAIAEQMIPATINCESPLPGINAGSAPARSAKINTVLTYSAGIGGQNAALVLKKIEV